MARNAGRLDARITVTAGAALFFLSMYKMSTLTMDSGTDELFWPLVFRGVGLGLTFVPLTNATVSELTPRQIPQGTGMFNLMRQLGGSLGIAIMATLLSRQVRVEKAMLTEHVMAYSPETQARLGMLTRGLMTRGADALTAQRQALAVVDRQIGGQASVLAFSKIYLWSGLILVGALPLLLIWKHGKAKGMLAADAH
jgi:DHA2 family multidrug resistance protein